VVEFSLEQTLTAWMIAGTRVTGVIVAAPFFGSLSVPVRIKLGLGFVFTMMLVPLVGSPGALSASALVSVLVGEFAIGFLLGFTLQFVFEGALVAGHVLGIQMGYSLASVINPQSQADTPVLATFHELIVLLLFIQLQVPHWLLRGLARSFQYLPPGNFALTLPPLTMFSALHRQLVGGGRADCRTRAGSHHVYRRCSRFSGQSIAAIAGAVRGPFRQEHVGTAFAGGRDCAVAAIFRCSLSAGDGSVRTNSETRTLSNG